MRDYVILRDLSRPRTREPFGKDREAARPLEAPSEPQLSTEQLSKEDVRTLSRDPEVQAIAQVMPTKLIQPVEMEGPAETVAWGISAVKADVSSCTGAGVVPAVLDTGIDATHPAFTGVDLVEQDFSGSGNGDHVGHGSHCAGTIFGRDVDNTRIGVARGVQKALIGKVLGNDGSGDSVMLFNGMQWAVEQGAQVISMSLGFDFPGLVQDLVKQGWPTDLATSVALEGYRANLRMFDALMEMIRSREPFGTGTLVVAAAGNESKRNIKPDYEVGVSLPAAAEGVVSVGALQQGDQGLGVAYFSNTFPQVSAPGVKILSVKAGGGLQEMSGTSMATPHVAGVTTLWWEAVGNLPIPKTTAALLAKLLATARTDVFAPGVDIADRGVGIVTAP